MSADTVWVTLLAAVFGALAAGGYDHYLRRQERNEERSAILNAICSEVSIICRLVRDSDFSDQIDNVLRMNIASREANRSIVYNFQVYMDQDYFVVFESLAPKVGFLNPEHAQIIVQFYGLAKMRSIASIETVLIMMLKSWGTRLKI